ncbi:MAG: glycosyltransferase [Leptolyngbya sp. SIO1E4]|nr:glycosyltransferase [Leptolyngbya sp. SIO1E4]
MPLVSVVIPAHNAEKTIKETIESVLAQSFQDFEIVIVNDNSTDSTGAIVEGYQDPRIKLFAHNGGSASKSRNKGVRHASGEYIAFLDADDLWLPSKLEMQLAALQKSPQAKVVYCWVDCIDNQGNFIRKSNRFDMSGDVYEEMLVHNFLGNGSNPLIEKEALIKVGDFDESLPNAEDWDLYLRLAQDYHFVAIPSPLVLYRVSYNSKSFRNLLRSEASYTKLMNKACARRPESAQVLVEKGFPGYYKYIILKALKNPLGGRRRMIAFRLLLRFVFKFPGFLKNLDVKYSSFLLIVDSFKPKSGVRTWLKKALIKSH